MASSRSAARAVAAPVGWAALLAVALLAGRASRPAGSGLAVVWPAAAITVVWLLRTRPGRSRVAVTATMALIVTAVNALTGTDVVTSAAFGLVNVAHGWAGLVVLERRRWPSTTFLPSMRDALTLCWASLAASAVSALLGSTLAAVRLGADLVASAGLLLSRNLLSTAVLGAALLALPHLRSAARSRHVSSPELAGIVAAGAAAHAVAFRAISDGHPVAFLLAPVWVWVGARVSTATAAVLVTVMAVPTVLATTLGDGGFAYDSSVQERVLLAQAFMAVGAVVALGLAVISGERRAALDEARRRTDQLEAYLQASLVGSAVLDVATGALTSANPALHQLLGTSPGGLDGSRWREHVTEQDVTALDTALGALRSRTATAWHGELGHRTRDGDVRVAQVALAVVPDDGGSVATVQFLDVTERREAERRLAHRVLHDELTGLPNRTMLRDHLELALAQRRRPAVDDVAVLFFDLDHFKAVNDTYGHDAGDQLLVQFAARMAGAMRPGDTVARVGGDEFVALCTGLSGAEEASHVAERVLEAVRAPVQIGDAEVVVGISVGVAIALPGDTASSLLQQSDTAMFAAKHRGRGRVATHGDPLPRPRPRPGLAAAAPPAGPARGLGRTGS